MPLFLIVLGAPTRDSVAMSNVCIMGGSLTAFLVNVRRRHPTLNRPLIDWDVMLLMEPTTIMGAVVGGYLNRVSPPWATTSALALLLVAITAQLTVRAMCLWQTETAAGRSEGAALLADAEAATLLPPHDPHADSRLFPLAKAAVLTALTVVVVASDEFKKRVTLCGSVGYWVAAGAIIPAVLCVATVARSRVLREAASTMPPPTDGTTTATSDAPFHWTPRTATLFPALSTLAGIVAGAFGVGGGIVKGPILLELGVAPPVAAATSAAMIMFTSAAACAVYISFGAVRRDYGSVLFLIGAAFTSIGLTLVSRAVAHLGRRSVIVVTMAVLLGVSAAAATYEAGVLTVDVARRGTWGEHGHVCS